MGIQINGATDSITAIDGTIDVVSAIGNAGVVTATAFVGNITGNVTGNINHASNLELQVGGVTRGKFDSSGRLLIGTTTEGHGNADDLTIATTDHTGITLRSATNRNGSVFFSDGTSGADEYRGWIQYTHTSDYLTFGTNGDERLRIKSTGQVGIGTDNPTEDLHITGDTPVIRLEDSDTSRQSQIVGIDGNLRFDADNGNAQADTNISFRTDGTEVLRITSDRKVGINRTSPARHLHAYAAGAGFVAKFEGSYSYSAVEFADTGTTNAPYIGSNGDHFTIATGGNNERFRITSAGNVGIGSETPGRALTIRAAEPRIRLQDSDSGGHSEIYTDNSNHLYLTADSSASAGGSRIVFQTDGANERARIDNNGNFIFYNSAAAYNTLQRANTGHYIGLRIQETDGTQRMQFVVAGQSNDIVSGSAQHDVALKAYNANLILATNATERLRITSGGKIGINQSGPFADVDITSSVEDTDNSSLAQHGIRLAHIGAANEEVIPITAGFVTQQNRARAGIGFISKTISGADGMGGAIGFYTRNTADGHALYRADERVRITESGQFLVGATSSNGARAVIQQNSSDTNPLDQQTCADSSGLRLHNYSFSTGRYTALSMECCNTSSVQSASIVAQSTGSGTSPNIIITQRNSNSTNAERLRINSDGYVVKGAGLTCAFNVSGTNMSRSDTSGYICDFDDDSSSGHFDSGNNFNTSTHKFVAPVSGYYYFFTNIRLDAFNSGYIRTAIMSTSYNTNTTYYTLPATGHVITYADNGSIQTVQTSTVMYLPATHEAWVYQDPSSDSSYTCYLNESSFGGYFIG